MIWHIREKLGLRINHKRITRVYRSENLQLGQRPKVKRKEVGRRHLFVAPTRPNQLWAMDFVSDSFSNGKRFRVHAIKDLFTHECLSLHVDRSITGEDLAKILDLLIVIRGARPEAIICDNGTEYTSKAMSVWEHATGVILRHIEPGKPIQNAFIESFNGKLRRECLDQSWFEDLKHARQIIESWRLEYNSDRPTKPLGNKTPDQFAKEWRLELRIQNQN